MSATSPVLPYSPGTSPAAEVIDQVVDIGPNGLFKGNVDAAGYTLGVLGGLSVGYKTTKEVCIGKRTSGKTGSGSYDDPFAANTKADFDAIMADTSKAAQAGTRIRLRDGEYLTSSLHYGSRHLRARCHFVGEGIGNTILKLDPSVGSLLSGNMNVISSLNTVDGDGIYVADMTVDCNYTNLSAPTAGAAVNGVSLFGNNNLVERVRVINGYGLFGSTEHFGILLAGRTGDSTSYNNQIVGCIAEQFLGDYGGGLVVTGPSGGICTGGVVTRSRVSGYKPAGGIMSGKHVGGIGCLGGTISFNEITGCQIGIYNEGCAKVQVIGNNILNCWEGGIHMNAANPITDIQIIGNVIVMRDDGDTYVQAIAISDSNGGILVNEVHGCQIIGNILRQTTTGNPIVLAFNYGIRFANVANRGYQIIGNTVDQKFTTNFAPATAYITGNRNDEGAIISSLLDASPAMPVTSIEAHATTTQTIPHNADTKILLATEDHDTESVFASSVFTAPQAGWYHCYGYCEFVLPTVGDKVGLDVMKNAGTERLRIDEDYAYIVNDPKQLVGSATIYLAAADTLELSLTHNDAASVATTATSGFYPRLKITYLHA